MKKKIIIAIIILILLSLSGYLIYIGIKMDKNSKPSVIYGKVIDNLSARLKEISKIDSNYNFGDSFSIDGTLDLDLTSEYYINESKTDPEYLKKNNILKNISNMNIKYNVKQDNKNDKLFLSIDEKINDKEVLSAKYLTENSTKYYFVNEITKNYINVGSSNYFETLDENNTTITNIDYLYDTIINSIKNYLKDEYFDITQTEEDIKNKRISVTEIAIRFNNERIIDLQKAILNDMKNDSRAANILNSFIKDFNKTKVDESKRYLENNEYITISIFTKPITYTPLKFKITYLNENEKKVFSIEDNKFIYLEKNMVKYMGEIIDKGDKIDVNVKDSLGNDKGNIKFEKGEQNTTISVSLDLEKYKFNIEYSNKYKDIKKKLSYTNEKTINLKIMNNMINKISGNIKLVSNVNSSVIIDENTADAVLESTLKEEEKDKMDNLYNNIKERLEK